MRKLITRNLRKMIAILAIIFGTILFGKGIYMTAKAELSQVLISHAWAKNHQTTTELIKPWPWADTSPIAKLTIPSLDITQYIMSDANGESLAFGAGRMLQGVMPASNGHSFIAGHRDTHFKFIKHLMVDDIIHIENYDGVKKQYKIFNIEIMDINKQTLTKQENGNFLTLITCYPFNELRTGGPLRYVVHAIENS